MAAPRAVPAPRPAPGPFWVLLVDDQVAILSVIHRAMTRRGHAVTSCTTVAEALRAIDQADGPPAVVISDVLLPDGEAAYVVHAARAKNPGVRVIMMSGLGEDVAETPLVEDAEVFLAKPFPIDRLVDVVSRFAAEV